MKRSVHVLFVVGPAEFYPSTIVRIRQYFPRLLERGIEPRELPYASAVRERWYQRYVTGPGRVRNAGLRLAVRAALNLWARLYRAVRQVQLGLLGRRVDALFIQKVLLPQWLVRWLSWRGTKLIYDFDDAVFVRDPHRARAIVRAAWRVVAGSHFNLEFAQPLNPASVLVPSAVPIEEYRPRTETPPKRATVCIGWVGSPSTLHYLALVAEPLRRLAARGLPASLLIAGTQDRIDLLPNFGDLPVELVPRYRGADLPALLSRVDIGLMPLADGAWERGKCAMKALLYMAAGCPALCSPVGEAVYVVEDRMSGFLPSGLIEWEQILTELIESPERRADVGARGRAVVLERYSSTVCFALLDAHVFAPLRAGNTVEES